MTDTFLLHVSVSGDVRQTTQINFDDLGLPETVKEVLIDNQAISIRPTLSKRLAIALKAVRIKQRHLYERCTIHSGDIHFLHRHHFKDAMARMEELKREVAKQNEIIREHWQSEFDAWSQQINDTLSPLISGDALDIARNAYLSIFPTREQYQSPISLEITGPNPVSIEVVENPDDPAMTEILQTGALNTAAVLQAAKDGAEDDCLLKVAQLLDDLDSRTGQVVGQRQTSDNDRRRGSWQIAAEELALAATHVPGLVDMAKHANDLISFGKTIQGTGPARQRDQAFKGFQRVKEAIKKEAQDLIASGNASKGRDSLEMSLTFSSTFEDLKAEIKLANTDQAIDELQAKIDLECAVYRQRTKQLTNLISKQQELVIARGINPASIVAAESERIVSDTTDCDF